MTDDTTPATDARSSADASDDIRLIGRLIGDVLREQAGDDVFDLVESVRRTAVRGRRAGQNPIGDLADLLDDADVNDQLHLIRAFGWLSLLANTAEDLHTERRRRHHRDSGSGSQEGSIDAGLQRMLAAGVDADRIADELADLRVSPVITAHPTEVRRQTVLDHVDAVSGLLARRARAGDSPSELAEIDDRLRLEVLTLWQTAEVRLSKLRVRDEINEALRYYRSSIFETVTGLQPRCRGSDRGAARPPTSRTRMRSRWGPGSGATETATRTSPPRCCGSRSRCRPRSPSNTT